MRGPESWSGLPALAAIEPKYDFLIPEKIEEQLLNDAGIETTNRKPLKRPIAFDAEWELRFGPGNRFRVLYQIKRRKRGKNESEPECLP